MTKIGKERGEYSETIPWWHSNQWWTFLLLSFFLSVGQKLEKYLTTTSIIPLYCFLANRKQDRADDHPWHWFSFCPWTEGICDYQVAFKRVRLWESLKTNLLYQHIFLVFLRDKQLKEDTVQYIRKLGKWKEWEVFSKYIWNWLFFPPHIPHHAQITEALRSLPPPSSGWVDSLIVTSWRGGKKRQSQQGSACNEGAMRFEAAHYQHLEPQGSRADSGRGSEEPWEDLAVCGRGTGRNKWRLGIDITSRVSPDIKFFFNIDSCNLCLKLLVWWGMKTFQNPLIKTPSKTISHN